MIQVKPNLSEQQICFCDEYLVSFNAYRSAINAGYSENTARKGELLHTPKIQEYLRLKMQQRGERMEITHDMILREYAKIAFSSMANYYDERGDLKPIRELTETEMAAISHLQITDIAEADGYKVGNITKIKLHNKMAALDKIAKHLGFFNQNQESRGENQNQESRGENQTQESRDKNQDQEKIVENQTQESRDKNRDQETRKVEAENLDEIDFDNESVIESSTVVNRRLLADGFTEEAENILTLSPLLMIDGLGFDGLNGNYIPTEALAVSVSC